MAKRLRAGALGLALCFVACDGTVGDGTSIDEVDGDGGPDGTGGDGNSGDGRDGASQDGASGDGDSDGAADGSVGDGAPNDGSPGDGDGDGAPDGLVPGIVAVGYGGLRVTSRDHGRTWSDAQWYSGNTGGHDGIIRGVAYGNGVWVGSGTEMLTLSSDGVNWDAEPRPLPAACTSNGNTMENVAFGNGVFVGACGQKAVISSNGETWESGGVMGDFGARPRLRFGKGQFVATGDNGSSFVSTDGRSWSRLEGVSFARLCDGEIKSRADCPMHQNAINDVEGIWVEDQGWFIGEWGGHIWRSENGLQYERVYTDSNGAAPVNFAAGFVAP